MEDPTYLAKVKGIFPERFMFITMLGDYSGIKRTSDSMSEVELRAFFRVNGKPGLRQDEIDSRIETARRHEV
ncbi:MAG: hypothetical protein DMG80_02495 [Acidobacteria bacterium]|nr:MAG: hypothetical protein DMG80_02495 [Acidobacteriota bacterium]